MTYLTKAVLWFFLGPIGSFAVGCVLFLLFGFILGTGLDIDRERSSFEAFFDGLSITAFAVVSIGGSIGSIACSIRYLLLGRASFSETAIAHREVDYKIEPKIK